MDPEKARRYRAEAKPEKEDTCSTVSYTHLDVYKRQRDYRVYVVMGDGELAEGSVWEGAMAAHHYKLDNLCAVVDRNRLQISGSTEAVMAQDDVGERFASFGWNVINVENGNDIDQLDAAFEQAKQVKGKPTCLLYTSCLDTQMTTRLFMKTSMHMTRITLHLSLIHISMR